MKSVQRSLLKNLRCKRIKTIEEIEKSPCLHITIKLTKKLAYRIAMATTKLYINEGVFKQSPKKIIRAIENAGIEIIIVKKNKKERIIDRIKKARNKKKALEKQGIARSTFYYWLKKKKISE